MSTNPPHKKTTFSRSSNPTYAYAIHAQCPSATQYFIRACKPKSTHDAIEIQLKIPNNHKLKHLVLDCTSSSPLLLMCISAHSTLSLRMAAFRLSVSCSILYLWCISAVYDMFFFKIITQAERPTSECAVWHDDECCTRVNISYFLI